jgi:hypothetical protein
LWALDEKTLEMRNFKYDGLGPDAFFIVGTQTASSRPNLKDGIPVPHPNSNKNIRKSITDPNIPVLTTHNGQTIQLHLPPGVKVSDIQWLSLYCRDFVIDFGNVLF